MNTQVRKFIRELERRGWVIVRFTGSGHVKVQYKNGIATIFPSSPSDARWIKNKKAEIKRIEGIKA